MEWVTLVSSLIATAVAVWATLVAYKALALQRRADEREAERYARENSPAKFEVSWHPWANPGRQLYGIRLVNRSDREHNVERVNLLDREGKFVDGSNA